MFFSHLFSRSFISKGGVRACKRGGGGGGAVVCVRACVLECEWTLFRDRCAISVENPVRWWHVGTVYSLQVINPIKIRRKRQNSAAHMGHLLTCGI